MSKDNANAEGEGEAKARRQGPRKPPLPSHWDELLDAVTTATTLHHCDDANPLHEIDRFEVISPRGRGGFGLVFEVRDPKLDRHVALKMCLTRGPRAAAAITREAKLLAKVSHPNVITVHETGQYGDDVFFVMEYVAGMTGRGFMRKGKSWREIVELYRDAGAGLAAAHDAGVVHGDFKPANILMDEDARWPRVADFGLAQLMLKHAPEGERAGLRFRVGTLPYMAPELLRGRATDALADQWAFCVSLWETLEGGLPFRGGTPEELLVSIEQGEPWTIRPETEVPVTVRAIVRVGLAVEPGERYRDMHALLGELGELGELTKPAPVEPPEPASAPAPPAPEDVKPVMTPREPRNDRSLRGIFAAALALGVMLGSLVTALMVGPGDTRSPTPALPTHRSEPAPAVEIDPVVREVLHLIWAGDLDQANKDWETESGKRHMSALPASTLESMTPAQAAEIEAISDKHARMLAHDTLQIARTFMYRAVIFQIIDAAGARRAANRALQWAAGASEKLAKLDEDTTEADELAMRARRIAAAN